MKISSLIAGTVLVVVPLAVGYQFFHWKAERRETRAMAYICAGNSDYLIDPLDMNLSEAHVEPARLPATGEPLLYKGQPVETLLIPSLTTQASRYKCAMYKSADTGRWTVLPRRKLRGLTPE